MSSNCFSSLLTSCTDVPDPAAIRFLRLAFRMSGLRFSLIVIDEMIAAWRLKTAVSRLASAICAFTFEIPGSMPRMPEMLPILPICFSWLA